MPMKALVIFAGVFVLLFSIIPEFSDDGHFREQNVDGYLSASISAMEGHYMPLGKLIMLDKEGHFC